jgi:predicted TIM-barrel enzyme
LPGTPRGVLSIAELVQRAKDEARVYRECGVDGIIIENMHDVPDLVTGSVTGEAPQLKDVREAKGHCHLPVFLGSGISESNIEQFYEEADGFIIGSAFKIDGLWSNTVDPNRVTQFVHRLRG